MNESKSKKLFVIIGLILVIVVAITVIMINGQNKGGVDRIDIPDDAMPYTNINAYYPTPVTNDLTNNDGTFEAPEILKNSFFMVAGADFIAKDGRVINFRGEEVLTNVLPGSTYAPQSISVPDLSLLPASVIRLDLSATGFSPNEFRVKAKQPITIAVSSIDLGIDNHSFRFSDEELSAIVLALRPGETRVLTFNAPAIGEYSFHCNVSGHEDRGEIGLMIVE